MRNKIVEVYIHRYELDRSVLHLMRTIQINESYGWTMKEFCVENSYNRVSVMMEMTKEE